MTVSWDQTLYGDERVWYGYVNGTDLYFTIWMGVAGKTAYDVQLIIIDFPVDTYTILRVDTNLSQEEMDVIVEDYRKRALDYLTSAVL